MEQKIVSMLHQDTKQYNEETHYLVESMLEENKHYYHQMTWIRWALVGASLSVFSFFLAAILNGFSVFQTAAVGAATATVPLNDAGRAFTVIGAFCLAAGLILTCIELSEVLTPQIKLDRARVDHEHERAVSSRPTYAAKYFFSLLQMS